MSTITPLILLALGMPTFLVGQVEIDLTDATLRTLTISSAARPPAEDPRWLNPILGVVPDGDHAFVLQRYEQRVFKVDASGKPIATFGRRGEGPGEFRSPAGIGWRGDTLWVADSRQKRFSMFSSDGEHIRTALVPFKLQSPWFPAPPLSILAEGSYLMLPTMNSLIIAANGVAARPLVVTDSMGFVRDTLEWLSIRNRNLRVWDEGAFAVARQPFGDDPIVATAPGGETFAVVERGTDGTNSIRVARFDSLGQRAGSIKIVYTPEALPNAASQAALKGLVDILEMSESKIRDSLYIPQYYPPVTRAVLGTDGVLWLQRESLPESPSRWIAIGAQGQLIGQLELPQTAQIWAVDGETAWITSQQEDDLMWLRAERLGMMR